MKRHYNMLSHSVNGIENLNNRLASVMSMPIISNVSTNTNVNNINSNKDQLLILTPQHNRV